MKWIIPVLVALSVIAAPLAVPADADSGKVAGTIAAVSPDGRTITIEQMGPWYGPQTKPTRLQVSVPDTASVVLFERVGIDHVGDGGWYGGYKRETLSRSDLRSGDFATVTTRRENGRLVAERVEVVRPSETQS